MHTIKKKTFLIYQKAYIQIYCCQLLCPNPRMLACSPWCSSFSFNCLGLIYGYEEKNLPPLFIMQINYLLYYESWCLMETIGRWRSFRLIAEHIHIEINIERVCYAHYGVGSMPIRMLISLNAKTVGFQRYNNISRWEMRWHQSTLVLRSILFYNVLMSSGLIVLKSHLRLWIFDFKMKFITVDKTLIRQLWVIVVHNLVQSKVWRGTLAFFLVFLLFNFVTIWNAFSATENF